MTEEQQTTYQSIKSKIDDGAPVEFACAMFGASVADYQCWEKSTQCVAAPGKEEDELALESINTTSQTVRNLFVTFVLLLVSIGILIASTDTNTLFTNGKLNLPLINIGLPASNFFAVAPLLILVLHGNLLFNIYVLQSKLHACSQVKDHLLFPFVYTQMANRQLHGAVRIVGATILISVFAAAPVVCLAWLQWRFIIFQSDAITFFHKICIFADILMIIAVFYVLGKKSLRPNEK